VEKVVWLAWGDPARPTDVVDRFRPLAADPSVLGLVLNQHDEEAAEAPPPVPYPAGEDVHVVEVGAWVANYQRREAVEAVVASLGMPWAAYLVAESVVDDYGTTPHAGSRDWPDGVRSPGVLTVALIHRPPGMGDAEWIHNWHEVQSPESGAIQPRCRYVRQQVVRALTPDAPEVEGIVDEAWPSPAHVADPMLFFEAGGDPAVLQRNVERMLASTAGCLDMDRFRTATMSEHLLKTPGGSP
jgi:hypothetical protein